MPAMPPPAESGGGITWEVRNTGDTVRPFSLGA